MESWWSGLAVYKPPKYAINSERFNDFADGVQMWWYCEVTSTLLPDRDTQNKIKIVIELSRFWMDVVPWSLNDLDPIQFICDKVKKLITETSVGQTFLQTICVK
jgi:hypothetical protein